METARVSCLLKNHQPSSLASLFFLKVNMAFCMDFSYQLKKSMVSNIPASSFFPHHCPPDIHLLHKDTKKQGRSREGRGSVSAYLPLLPLRQVHSGATRGPEANPPP